MARLVGARAALRTRRSPTLTREIRFLWRARSDIFFPPTLVRSVPPRSWLRLLVGHLKKRVGSTLPIEPIGLKGLQAFRLRVQAASRSPLYGQATHGRGVAT